MVAQVLSWLPYISDLNYVVQGDRAWPKLSKLLERNPPLYEDEGLEECRRMTQVRLAPMHVNCRQSFPSRGSHEEWEERRNGASPRLSDGNNGHHSHRSEKVLRNRNRSRLAFRCGSRDVAKLEENCNLSNLKDGIVNNFSIKSTYCFFVDQKVGLVYNVG